MGRSTVDDASFFEFERMGWGACLFVARIPKPLFGTFLVDDGDALFLEFAQVGWGDRRRVSRLKDPLMLAWIDLGIGRT